MKNKLLVSQNVEMSLTENIIHISNQVDTRQLSKTLYPLHEIIFIIILGNMVLGTNVYNFLSAICNQVEKDGWVGVKQIIMIKTPSSKHDKEFDYHYFISSKERTAKEYLAFTKNHWKVKQCINI